MATKPKNETSNVVDPRVKYMEQYDALGMLRKYPPFSTDLDMTETFLDDVHAATRSVSDKINAASMAEEIIDDGSMEYARLFEGAFEIVEDKWADELDIARLYQKRYGDDYISAQEEALAADNRTTESPNVPSLG